MDFESPARLSYVLIITHSEAINMWESRTPDADIYDRSLFANGALLLFRT